MKYHILQVFKTSIEFIKKSSDHFKDIYVPDQVGTLAQDVTIPNMGWPNKELTTLSLIRPKIP